jgi:hypothetical protein
MLPQFARESPSLLIFCMILIYHHQHTPTPSKSSFAAAPLKLRIQHLIPASPSLLRHPIQPGSSSVCPPNALCHAWPPSQTGPISSSMAHTMDARVSTSRTIPTCLHSSTILLSRHTRGSRCWETRLWQGFTTQRRHCFLMGECRSRAGIRIRIRRRRGSSLRSSESRYVIP